MSKKTFKVEDLVAIVNGICKDSDADLGDVRRGAMNTLECVLHRTGNYGGFRYLRAEECRGKPGVNYEGNMPHPDIVARFKDTDPTRVHYF